MWGAPHGPAQPPLLPPPFQDLVLFNLHRVGVLGLRGGSAGAQVGAQVPTKFVLGLLGHGALGGTAGVPFPLSPQGRFCCHHLFLHGRGWDGGVDPLPAAAPGAEGVLFPKQAGTRVGESEIPPAIQAGPAPPGMLFPIPYCCSALFLLGDEKNLFSRFLCFLGSVCPAPADLAGARLGLAMALDNVPTPWGEQDSVPSPALGLFPLGFLSLWDYPGQLLAGEQEGFLLSQVPPPVCFCLI